MLRRTMMSFFTSGRYISARATTASFSCEQRRAPVLVLVLACFYVSMAFAQQPFGTLVGTVTDQTGRSLARSHSKRHQYAYASESNGGHQRYGRLFRTLPHKRGIHDKGGTPELPGSAGE